MSETAIEPSVQTVVARIHEGEATADEMLGALDRADAVVKAAKEWKQHVEAAAVQWLTIHGPQQFGTRKLWAGIDKDTKAIADTPTTYKVLIESAGGDEAAIVGCLKSGAFKHGAVKKLVSPEIYNTLFKVVEKPVLNDVGKPVKTLQSIDTRFTD